MRTGGALAGAVLKFSGRCFQALAPPLYSLYLLWVLPPFLATLQVVILNFYPSDFKE